MSQGGRHSVEVMETPCENFSDLIRPIDLISVKTLNLTFDWHLCSLLLRKSAPERSVQTL